MLQLQKPQLPVLGVRLPLLLQGNVQWKRFGQSCAQVSQNCLAPRETSAQCTACSGADVLTRVQV